jgi:hypothetical protein
MGVAMDAPLLFRILLLAALAGRTPEIPVRWVSGETPGFDLSFFEHYRCSPEADEHEGVLWGRVVSDDSLPAEHVIVGVGGATPTPCGALTDFLGHYAIHGMPKGWHKVTIQQIGFEVDSVRVHIAGDTVRLDSRLEIARIPLVGPEVRGRRPDSVRRPW